MSDGTVTSKKRDYLTPPVSPEKMAEINKQIQVGHALIGKVKAEMALAVVGQTGLIDSLLLGLLSDGHVLVEGVPGLAKTWIIQHLSECIQAQFHRIQFTPDLLPADVVGTLIYSQKTSEFETRKGPIFTNILLADEINRCPPKVQSALLEAMQEHQVTLGDHTYPLPEPFLVMATENPIEQEGTYPLPEAQIDRFMIKAYVDYPTAEEEYQILEYIANDKAKLKLSPVLTLDDVEKLRTMANHIYMAEELKRYIVNLVLATRNADEVLPKLKGLVAFGASPRATINLAKCARSRALLNARAYVTPQDIKDVAPFILGHRVLTTYEADAEEITSDEIAAMIIDAVPVP
jgi:MoxR-like ATPase